MPIVGMGLKNIQASRDTNEVTGEIKINSNTNLKEVKEIDLPFLNQNGLSIEFEHIINYETENEKLGSIKIAGDVLFVDKEHKKILADWNKTKTLPEEISLQIVNNVLKRCVIKSLNLSEDLQLPPSINLPIVQKGERKKQ